MNSQSMSTEPNRGWRITTKWRGAGVSWILKKKSSGPSIGKPSLRSRQLFFMASYATSIVLESSSAPKASTVPYGIEDELYQTLLEDDVELMKFGSRLLQQVLFGDETIAVTEEARQAIEERERQAVEQAAEGDEKSYDPAKEPVNLA